MDGVHTINGYYSFIEIKNVLFPTVPKSTVRGWLRELQIKCVPCTEEERTFFKSVTPSLASTFGKISAADLQRLTEYASHKRGRNVQLFPGICDLGKMNYGAQSTHPITTSMFVPMIGSTNNNTGYIHGQTAIGTSGVSPASTTTASFVQPFLLTTPTTSSRSAMLQPESSSTNSCGFLLPEENSNIISSECLPVNTIEHCGNQQQEEVLEFFCQETDNIPGGSEHAKTAKNRPPSTKNVECASRTTAKASCSAAILATDDAQDLELAVEEGVGSTKAAAAGTRYSLCEEHITTDLKHEFKLLKDFYMSDVNSARTGQKLQKSSFAKLNERLLCFLGFVKASKPTETLTLSLTTDLQWVDAYVNYLAKDRKLMASTVSRNISAIVSGIKFARRQEHDIDRLPVMHAIRNMQRQLSGEESLTRKRKREGFSSKRDRQLFFSHILDTLRQLREQYHHSSGLESSRHLHDFTMLTLYTRALPGRAKELRTLVLIDRSSGSLEAFSTEDVNELNALVFQPDGSVQLVEADFKTVRKVGPSKIDLTDDEWLVYYLKTYVTQHRPALIQGKEHHYVFFNKNGDPFLGIGSLSTYLGDLFEREVDIRASTNKMRHAIVTHFMSLPESDNLKLRESLAVLLKHSVRHQQNTYNDQRRHDKVEMGREFLRKVQSDGDPYNVEDSEMSSIKSSSQCDADGEKDILPNVGEICALLDPVSSGPNDAFIFVAKVLRYTPDKTSVCLQEMECLPQSSDLYRVKCSSVWWERVETLCYPIDIVYVASEKAYHLRSTPEQIYNDVISTK